MCEYISSPDIVHAATNLLVLPLFQQPSRLLKADVLRRYYYSTTTEFQGEKVRSFIHQWSHGKAIEFL